MAEIEELKIDAEAEEIKITEAEKEEFFKCFLADKPYQEELELFGGKFKVKFKTLTINENEQVVAQVQLDQKNGEARNDDMYFITISTYRLAIALTDINGAAFQPEIDKRAVALQASDNENITLVKARSAIFKNWPAYKLTAIVEAFSKFEKKVIKLTKETLDANFWTADK